MLTMKVVCAEELKLAGVGRRSGGGWWWWMGGWGMVVVGTRDVTLSSFALFLHKFERAIYIHTQESA